MFQSADFCVPNVLKHSYEHLEVNKMFRLACARHKGEREKNERGNEREVNERNGRGYEPLKFFPDTALFTALWRQRATFPLSCRNEKKTMSATRSNLKNYLNRESFYSNYVVENISLVAVVRIEAMLNLKRTRSRQETAKRAVSHTCQIEAKCFSVVDFPARKFGTRSPWSPWKAIFHKNVEQKLFLLGKFMDLNQQY